MSKFVSTVAEIASVLITVCVLSAGAGGATANTTSDDPPPPPPTTTQPTTEGNPWHG